MLKKNKVVTEYRSACKTSVYIKANQSNGNVMFIDLWSVQDDAPHEKELINQNHISFILLIKVFLYFDKIKDFAVFY